MPGTGRAPRGGAPRALCLETQFDGAFPPMTLAEFDALLKDLVANNALPRDSGGYLQWPRLHVHERDAIKLFVGRPYRAGRRLRGEALQLQFAAARAVRPQLGIFDFLERLSAERVPHG